MSAIFENIGIDPGIIIIILLIIVIILIGSMISYSLRLSRLERKYKMFMKGKDGKTLEESLVDKFAEAEAILKITKQNRMDIKEINKRMESDYQKIGIVKYDAFNEMGGKLSFVLAMLYGKNSGWILNAMHSREGCYTYAKEIVNGESYVELSEEEIEALDKAIFSDPYETDVKEKKKSKEKN